MFKLLASILTSQISAIYVWLTSWLLFKVHSCSSIPNLPRPPPAASAHHGAHQHLQQGLPLAQPRLPLLLLSLVTPPVFENMQVEFVLNPLLGIKRKPKRAR